MQKDLEKQSVCIGGMETSASWLISLIDHVATLPFPPEQATAMMHPLKEAVRKPSPFSLLSKEAQKKKKSPAFPNKSNYHAVMLLSEIKEKKKLIYHTASFRLHHGLAEKYGAC